MHRMIMMTGPCLLFKVVADSYEKRAWCPAKAGVGQCKRKVSAMMVINFNVSANIVSSGESYAGHSPDGESKQVRAILPADGKLDNLY